MERVQVLGTQNIFSFLPSLYYLTLVDMLYFDCNWIKDMPQQIKSDEERITSTLGE